MKTIVVNEFSRGQARDRFAGAPGEFGFAKHFDTLTYPNRLQPLRGMTAHTASTGIGKLISSTLGYLFGIGTDPNNPTNGKLYNLTAFGVADDFAGLSSNQLSGAGVVYDFLVEWPGAGQVRTVFWSSTNLLVCSDPLGASGVSTDALTFTTIGQGLVHPFDRLTLYFPYNTSSAQYIGLLASNGSAFAGKNYTALTLPSQYRAYCLSWYGNYLAIPQTTTYTTSENSSVVYLWDISSVTASISEAISWGNGSLQVLNNLNGVLVGISQRSGNYAGTFQDQDAIDIKIYGGGTEPVLLKTILAQHLIAASHPSVSINPRVNFIYNNRLYFSINVVPGDSKQASWYGLWSVGKNLRGEWVVQMERVATNANSDTGVIAAAIAGDYVEMVHTAVGTLTKTTNGVTAVATYGATSVYESLVNPNMPLADFVSPKELFGIGVNFLPLPSGASVVLKYRVDSDGSAADWITAKTYTTANSLGLVTTDASGDVLKSGTNYEFRIESTGGAVPLSFAYTYKPDTSTNV